MESNIIIDGQPISAIGWHDTGAPDVGTPDSGLSFEAVPGLPGGVDATLTDATGRAVPGMRAVTASLWCAGTHGDVARAEAALAAIDGAWVTMAWDGLPGHLAGRAMLTGRGARTTPMHAMVTRELQLTAQPYLLGVPVTVQGGSLRVEGTRPVAPVVRVTSDGSATLSVADGHGHRVTLAPTGGVASGAVAVIDCGAGQCTIGGAGMAPTLDSDWLRLLPGMGAVIADGGAVQSVSYIPLYDF